jgi:hypothetical protein
MCSRLAYLHLIVSANDFHLEQGEASLTRYTFNTHTAVHMFCSVCGVKPFYVPRSHPDGYSVNARCLDPGTVSHMTVVPFDGQHWEEHVEALRAVVKRPTSDDS